MKRGRYSLRHRIDVSTLEGAHKMIDVLSRNGAVDRLSAALGHWPEMKDWSLADIARNLGLARETVTRNIGKVNG